MTYDEVITMLEEAGLPLAYDHFAEGESPDPPFLIFLYPGSDNMFADDTVFQKIDELNSWIYDNVNNGVYKAGFATSQEAYDEAVGKVFESLERLEQILGQHRYLTGDRLTEADIRLWTTLVRFDPVYVTHFKCDKHRISDYLNLYGFLRDIYQMPGIAETVDFNHIRTHYFRSHKTINPTGIISVGPWQDLDEPHGRDVRFG